MEKKLFQEFTSSRMLTKAELKSIVGGQTNAPCVHTGCKSGQQCDKENDMDGGNIECQYTDAGGQGAYCCKMVAAAMAPPSKSFS